MIKKVKTDDGSETFYNPYYGETYKSTSGAAYESMEKYARPTRLQEMAKMASRSSVKAEGTIFIMDVCFGLGYNSAAAIDIILEENPYCNISIVGLENDPEILAKTAEVNQGFRHYSIIRKAAKELEYKEGNVSIKIILGDARDAVKKLNQDCNQKSMSGFDAVFLDPFSPKKCPELWTEEFISGIYALMKKGAILTTYSCAGIVRRNLSKAGFSVKEGPCIGRRSPSLIAIKQK